MAVHRDSGRRLGPILVDMALVTEKDYAAALSKELDIPLFDLEEAFIDPAVVALVPEHLCERFRMIPVMKVDGRIVVAMMDPTNVDAIQDLETLTKLSIRIVLATPTQIRDALTQAFDELASQTALRNRLMTDTADDASSRPQAAAPTQPHLRIVRSEGE